MNEERKSPTANSGDQARINALRDLGLPRYVLLPGDPDRVDLMARQWDDAKVIELPRGYRAASGVYKGAKIGAVCTMMGAPALDRILTDLAALGVDTFIRVGTCGTLKAEIEPGSLIIHDSAVRLDGTTHLYVRSEFPAVASYEVTFALADAARSNNAAYAVGTGATTGSFFVGQGRPAYNDYMSPEGERIFEEMTRAGVLNFEMETAALLTLSRLFGLRAGSVCSVIANRVTGIWADNGGIERACLVAAETVKNLTAWDAKTAKVGAKTLTTASF